MYIFTKYKFIIFLIFKEKKFLIILPVDEIKSKKIIEFRGYFIIVIVKIWI